jgi:hypothetical protein
VLNLSLPKMAFLRHLPHHPSQVIVLGLSILAVIGAGALIAAALPEGSSDWMVASSYLAPAGVVFVVRWWLDQDV